MFTAARHLAGLFLLCIVLALPAGAETYDIDPTHTYASFEIDHLEIPAQVATAEVIASSARALAADGMHFEDPDLFELAGGSFEWPKELP